MRNGRRREAGELFDLLLREVGKAEKFGEDPREVVKLDRTGKERTVARVASIGLGADAAPENPAFQTQANEEVAACAFAAEFVEKGAQHFTVALVCKQCVEDFFEPAGMCGIRAENPREVRREMKESALEFAEKEVGRLEIGVRAGGE